MSDTTTLIKYVRDRLNDGPNITFGKPTVCDLVDALEQAEARAERAEPERKKDLAHCKYEFDRAEKAEANVARLTKMVGWLASKLSDHCLTDGGDRNISVCPTYIACRNATPEVWVEAARRAVAAGEG